MKKKSSLIYIKNNYMVIYDTTIKEDILKETRTSSIKSTITTNTTNIENKKVTFNEIVKVYKYKEYLTIKEKIIKIYEKIYGLFKKNKE